MSQRSSVANLLQEAMENHHGNGGKSSSLTLGFPWFNLSEGIGPSSAGSTVEKGQIMQRNMSCYVTQRFACITKQALDDAVDRWS